MLSIDDLNEQLGGLQGKRILVRSDLNVPLDKETGAVNRRRPDPRVAAHLASGCWTPARR